MTNLSSVLCLVLAFIVQAPTLAESRPNILWIVVDDMSPNFSSYGETTIATPHVDRLATEGTRFTHAYVTAPVCSACRSGLITGMYQTTIGAHHHRSGRGKLKIELPPEVTPLPKLFQEAGYFTCIGSGLTGKDFRGLPFGDKAANENIARDSGDENRKKRSTKLPTRLGKTDYNFEWNTAIYDSHDWSSRNPNQPFFMQVQLHGGKLREGPPQAKAAFLRRITQELGSPIDPATVNLPPYYPRDPVLLEDWANYLDSVRLTDKHVGDVIARLKAEGIYDNTLIVFMTDHGISHARGKQFLYDEGTHIPFIVRGPGIPESTERRDLVEHIDMAALSLAAAGIAIPETMQGRDLFAKHYQPRKMVFAARDRCDETVERIRSVRSDQYLYIRNYFPQRPHLQPNAYKDGKPTVQSLRASFEAGTLPKLTEQLLFSPSRPTEELYRYSEDRWQTNNLADDPSFHTELINHRQELEHWIESTGDQGYEPEAMYESDMAAYVGNGNPVVETNIAIMKQWAKEGK